jgi:Ran GTPase-activating protein (RanGAP) involved in mRNA processing and transport
VLIIFNLSNNDLDGVGAIENLTPYLRKNRNLLELNLSSNRLGDASMGRLAEVFEENKGCL